MSRLALKTLAASDLTLFASHARGASTHQKSITLNTRVFTGHMYPGLRTPDPNVGRQFEVSLYLYGPDAAPEQLVRRNVRLSAKNWRLNGEVIPNPDDERTRFDNLAAGDLAAIEFGPGPVPRVLRIVLLARGAPADAGLHAALAAVVGGRSMIVLDDAALRAALRAAATSPDHPAWD